MPLTYNNLWADVVNFESLYRGYCAASRSKRYRSSALFYREHLEENLINTLNLLSWGQWKPAPYREFIVYEPKKRIIQAPAFKDRVVHHALVKVIGPLFERKFIADSYACLRGRGTHAAKMRIEQFAALAGRKWGEYFVLKGDIKSYFYTIDRVILLDLVRRTISDRRILGLVERVIHLDKEPRGIPIGALTSQLFANVYLDSLDHFIKDDLGVKLYARYMDDFVLVHHDKGYLKKKLAEISDFVVYRLHLSLNPKTCIYRSGRGECHSIDFCGYRIWPGYTKPRKRTVRGARKRFRKLSELHAHGHIALERLRASVMSFMGYMKHCNGAVTLESTLQVARIQRGVHVETVPSPPLLPESSCRRNMGGTANV